MSEKMTPQKYVELLTFQCIREATKRAKVNEIERLTFDCVKRATKKANNLSFIQFLKRWLFGKG